MKLLVVLIILFLQSSLVAAEPPITALALTPDRQHYVTGSQAGIKIYQLDGSVPIRSLATKLNHVHDVVFSPDGNFLLAVGGAPAEAGEAELFRWPDGGLQHRSRLNDDLLYRAAWSSDAKWFVSCGHNNVCIQANLEGQSLVQYTGHSRPTLTVAVAPGDQQLLSAGMDQTIQIWTHGGDRMRTLNNHTAAVTDLLILQLPESDVTQLVSTSEDRTVRIWQPSIGRMIKFLRLENVPRRVISHRNGELIVGCDDGTLCVIDAAEMKVLATLKSKISPINEIAIASSGILVGGSNGMELFTSDQLGKKR